MASRRIEDLHPDFQPLVRHLLEKGQQAIASTGYTFFITDGYRSLAEQDMLYAKGRTAVGKVVTHAKAGQSAHNYGLAVDMAFQKNGVLSYSPALYEKVYPIARKLGLVLGADWSFSDKPHFEYRDWNTKIKENKTVPQILFDLHKNVTVTAAVGVKVRFSPQTTAKQLTTFKLGQVFSIKGFVEGESVSGNKIWLVTLDNYYVWSGATNTIPTPDSTATKIKSLASAFTEPTESDNDLARQLSLMKEQLIEAQQKQLLAESILVEKTQELITLKEQTANPIAINNANELLQEQIGAYKKHIEELKEKLGNAKAEALIGFDFIQVEPTLSTMESYKIVLAVVAKTMGLLKTPTTKGHVIGFKTEARVKVVSELPQEPEVIQGLDELSK